MHSTQDTRTSTYHPLKMSNTGSTSSNGPEKVHDAESFALLSQSLHGMSVKQPREAQSSQQSKKTSAAGKSKAKSTTSPSRSAASGGNAYEVTENALRLAIQAFRVEEGVWQQAQRHHLSTTPSSSPNGYAVSPESVQKLMSLTAATASLVRDDMTPVQRVQLLLAADAIMDPNCAYRCSTEANMKQAIDELDEAAWELLPPLLHVLKRGVDELATAQLECRRVERRINEILRANGEPELQMCTVHDCMDRSLPIPTRVPKPEAVWKAQENEMKHRLTELVVRKRDLCMEVLQVMKDHQERDEARERRETQATEQGKAQENAQDGTDAAPSAQGLASEGSEMDEENKKADAGKENVGDE